MAEEINTVPPQIKKLVRTEAERFWAKRRKEILLELVSLRDDSCARFRRRFPMLNVSVHKEDEEILKFRNVLQQLWRGDVRTFAVVASWVRYAQLQHTWTVGTWADGTLSVQPNYCLFPLCLAIAASEWGGKMTTCANPDCPQPYFLKGRKTQRFCDRPACIAYGQREHKRNWWSEHGEAWKRKQGKNVSPKGSSQKKGGAR